MNEILKNEIQKLKQIILSGDQVKMSDLEIVEKQIENYKNGVEFSSIESLLTESQELAKIGSWSYNFQTQEQIWTTEHYRIFEIPEPQSQTELYRLYRERIHPEDLPQLDQIMANALNGSDSFVFEHRIFLDSGRRMKYVKGIGRVQRDSEGLPMIISGTCQDITEMVHLQSQNKFILDSMQIGIWKFDPITQALDWDESMYHLFEMDPKDFSGHYQAWEKSLSPESKEVAIQDLQKALREEREFTMTFEIVTKDGRRKHIGSRGIIFRNKNHEPIRMFGLNWDRTKEVLMQASLAMERAKSIHTSKLASLGEMSAGIAHEINNPLAIIMAGIPLLKRFRENEVKFNEKCDGIFLATQRIERIIRGLRKFSRSSEGNHHRPFSLNQMIEDALVLVDTSARKEFVEIKVRLFDDFNLMCDSVEIEQVIVNLMANALYVAKNTSEKWIQIETFKNEHWVGFRVIDPGKGLPPGLIEKLFTPFFTTKPVGEGTGLGLSISKGIMDEHQGKIEINSHFADTCFEVSFPLDRIVTSK